MTGIYYRIERDGKWQSLPMEELTEAELECALQHFSNDHLISAIAIILQTASRDELISIINAYRKGVEEHD